MPAVHSLYRQAAGVEIDAPSCRRCGTCTGICPACVLRLKNGHPTPLFRCADHHLKKLDENQPKFSK